jgi:type II secretory pathway pseudopilin PulG
MNRSKCPECGFVGWANAESCKKCGAAISPSMLQAAAPAPAMAFAYPNAAVPMPNVAVPNPTYNVYPPAQLKTGLATASLVIGILNFLFLGIFVIPIVVGIVISIVALNKIKQSPQEYGGKSVAIGGLVTNIVSAVIVVPIMLMIAAIAIPNLRASIMAANEGAAISSLRRIHAAEQTYYSTVGDRSYGTLTDLQSQSLIPPELASGTKWGYRFKVEVSKNGFAATAVPTDYKSSGRRSFFVDETGILRAEDSHGLEASRFAPPVNSDPRSFGRRTSRDPDDAY